MSEKKEKKERKETKMYYGEYEIEKVEDGVDEGTKRITIKVNDKESATFDLPAWELTAAMTEKPSTASDVRNTCAVVVVDEIYEVFKKRNVKKEDLVFMSQKFVEKIRCIEENAINNCFGVSSKYDLRISHLEANQ